MEKLLIKVIETVVRKSKNPDFKFDSGVSFRILLGLVTTQIIMRVRSLKLIFRGRFVKGLQLGRNVEFRHLAKIDLGSGINLSDNVLLDALGSELIVIGDNSSIGAYSRLIISTSYSNLGKGIVLGKNVGIGEWCYIGGAGGVEIGSGTIVGQYFSIHAENHLTESLEIPIRLQGVSRSGVCIGQNVWIGSKVTILDGAEIGDGSIIAAGAVVARGKYPKNVILAGTPAKVIKQR